MQPHHKNVTEVRPSWGVILGGGRGSCHLADPRSVGLALSFVSPPPPSAPAQLGLQCHTKGAFGEACEAYTTAVGFCTDEAGLWELLKTIYCAQQGRPFPVPPSLPSTLSEWQVQPCNEGGIFCSCRFTYFEDFLQLPAIYLPVPACFNYIFSPLFLVLD